MGVATVDSGHAIWPAGYLRPQPDGAHLAYQVLGEGELDLVFLLGWPTHLALLWEHPLVAGFLSKLASFSRLILLDRLGEVVPLTVELRRRSMLDQAASSLVGVTAAMVWSSATRSAGRCR